jgi:acyl carrier protein
MTTHNRETITLWIQRYIGDLLGLPSGEVASDVEFASYGLTSSTAVALLADLEDELQCELSPALLFEHPTIDALTEHLEAALASRAQAAPPAQEVGAGE